MTSYFLSLIFSEHFIRLEAKQAPFLELLPVQLLLYLPTKLLENVLQDCLFFLFANQAAHLSNIDK